MNKVELLAKITEKTGDKKLAEKGLTAFLETIEEALIKGDKVQIVGFGTFETKERKSRVARNPKTGEKIVIPSKITPVFKAGKSLKEAVNA